MIYLKKFETESAYNAYTADTANFIKPNVSLIKETNGVAYSKYDFYDKYFTFVAREQGTFTLTIGSAVTTSVLQSISYSTDDGETWTTTNNVDSQTVTITTPTINQGDKVLWKGTGVGVSTTINNDDRPSTSSIFSSTSEFDAKGNIMSLIYGDEFADKTSVSNGSTYNFACLFYQNTKIVSAKNVCVPIKNVPTSCFIRAFQACSSLTEAPSVIDAENIGENGCMSMFFNCASLTEAPKLPATTLGTNAYAGIFTGCDSLVKAPELPATTLGALCYRQVFRRCKSLKIAPSILPATTMPDSCCKQMFQDCTSLVTVPELPATTLAYSCYFAMFDSCASLTTVPSDLLPATTLVAGSDGVYENMFKGCTSLTTAPILSAATLTQECYRNMFSGCTNLNSVTCLATDISATDCTTDWVNGVSSSGTFTKASSMSSWTSGASGIPSNWTVANV